MDKAHTSQHRNGVAGRERERKRERLQVEHLYILLDTFRRCGVSGSAVGREEEEDT